MSGFLGDLLASVPRRMVRYGDRRRRLARLRQEEMINTLRAGR